MNTAYCIELKMDIPADKAAMLKNSFPEKYHYRCSECNGDVIVMRKGEGHSGAHYITSTGQGQNRMRRSVVWQLNTTIATGYSRNNDDVCIQEICYKVGTFLLADREPTTS